MGKTRSWVAAIGALALLSLPALTLAGSAAEGKKVFDAKKCINCHSLGSEAGKMAKLGGPLDGVGKKRDAAWLKKFLQDPKAANPQSKMAKVPLTDAELANVVEYLSSLK